MSALPNSRQVIEIGLAPRVTVNSAASVPSPVVMVMNPSTSMQTTQPASRIAGSSSAACSAACWGFSPVAR